MEDAFLVLYLWLCADELEIFLLENIFGSYYSGYYRIVLTPALVMICPILDLECLVCWNVLRSYRLEGSGSLCFLNLNCESLEMLNDDSLNLKYFDSLHSLNFEDFPYFHHYLRSSCSLYLSIYVAYEYLQTNNYHINPSETEPFEAKEVQFAPLWSRLS